MKKLESSFLNMVVVLTTITLISAIGLGAMYNVTAEPIALAKKAKQETAIKNVLPAFTKLDTAVIVNDQKVFKAYDEQNALVGLAIETNGLGFGGNIKTMVGIDAKGNLVDYSILEMAETPGLGSKLVEWFKAKSDIRGANQSNLPLTVSKDGGQYDAITAATISSRAFLKSINLAYDTFKECMNGSDAVSGATTQNQTMEAATDSVPAQQSTEVLTESTETL